MTKSTTKRSPRKDWRRPELTRLNAGMAENFNVVMADGGLVAGTNLS